MNQYIDMDRDLSATEAARRLGVSVATLYAYVSRGLIQSRPGDDPRRRRYRHEDVERLLQTRRAGRGPRQGAARSLDWGLPVLETRISQILADGPHYRGHAAVALAQSGATLEDTARLLWACEDNPFTDASPPPWSPPVAALALDATLPPLTRAGAAMPLLEGASPRHLSPAPAARRESAALLTRQMTALVLAQPPSATPIHQAIAARWRDNDTELAELVRMALVLCADHELNASAFTARVVASTGASLHASVAAGLAALSGPLHGAATARAYALIEDLLARDDAEAALHARWQRGDPLPGFGHPLYPDGDPRGAALLQALCTCTALPSDPAPILLLVEIVESISGTRPSIDFALAALAIVYGQPADTALALFAAGRVVGWLAHAIEQQAKGGRIRPRARYVGDSVE